MRLPRCGSTSRRWSASAWRIGAAITPSGSCAGTSTSNSDSPAGPTPAVSAGANRSRSKPERSVNSQPGRPLNAGSSSADAGLANRALHLKLDQTVHLHRVLHGELLGDRLDKPIHDELGSLVL